MRQPRPPLRTRRNALIAGLGVSVVVLGAALASKYAFAVEEPKFVVVDRDGAIEIRDYPATVVAQVTVTGDQQSAVQAGFRLLAAYIFGGNTRRQSIAMTAPVAQAPAGEKIAMTAPVTQVADGNAWVVRFTMPANLSLQTLPQPNDPRVTLVAVPPARYAVVRFSGFASGSNLARHTAALMDYVGAHHLTPVGPVSIAQYDPPWTLWLLRRNEVMIPLQPVA